MKMMMIRRHIILTLFISLFLSTFAQIVDDPVKRIYTKMRIDSLYTAVNDHISAYNKEKAIKTAEQILEETKTLYGNNSEEVLTNLINLASLCSHLRDFHKAAHHGEEALSLIKEIKGKDCEDFAIVIDNLSKYHGEIGENEKAYEESKIAVRLWKKLKGEENLDYTFALNNYSVNCSRVNLITDALEAQLHSLRITEKIMGGRVNEHYAIGLDNLACLYHSIGDLERGIVKRKEAMEIFKEILSDDSWDWIICISNLADDYYELSEYEAAVPLLKQTLHSLELIKECNNIMYESTLLKIMNSLFYLEQYKEAIKYNEKILTIQSNNQSEKLKYSWLYLLKLYSLIQDTENLKNKTNAFEGLINEFATNQYEITKLYLLLAENFEKVKDNDNYKIYRNKAESSLSKIQDKTRALDIYIDIFYEYSLDKPKEAFVWGQEIFQIIQANPNINLKSEKYYCDFIERLCRVFDFNQAYNEAINLYNEKLSVLHDQNPIKYEDYIDAMIFYATLFSHKGDYKEAITLALQCEKIISENEINDKDEKLSYIYNNIGKYYAQLGQIEDAIEFYNKSLSLKDETSNGYIITLSNLAVCYGHLGNISKDIELSEKAVLLCNNPSIKLNTEEKATMLMNLGIAYSKSGDPRLTIEPLLKAYDLYSEFLGETHTQTLLAQCNAAGIFYNMGEYIQAAGMLGDAVIKMKEVLGEDNLYYIGNLANFALMAKETKLEGSKEKSIELTEKAIQLYKKYYGNDYPALITPLINLAHIEIEDCKYEEAFMHFSEALKCQEKNYGKDNIDYIDILNRILSLKIENDIDLNDDDNILSRYFCENLIPILKKEFKNFREDIRETFWYNNASYEGTLASLALSCKNITDKNFYTESFLNYVLVRKGLLLNTAKSFSDLSNSEDSEIKRIKSEINDLYAKLEILNKASILKEENLFDLKMNIKNKNTELTSLVNQFGDFTTQMEYDLQDVKKLLNYDEVAIEFVRHSDRRNNICYSAILIENNDVPKIVELSSQESLNNFDIKKSSKFDNLSKLIWEPLLPFITDKKKIYFSPDGEINNLPIESVFLDDETLISDKFEIFRLSSTREISNSHNVFLNTAVLFGDLNYNLDIQRNSNDVLNNLSYNDLSLEFLEELNRDGLIYLPATKIEVENINNVLSSNLENVILNSGSDGTETALKNLSGNPPSILHIATHGKYWDKDAFSNNERIKSILSNNDDIFEPIHDEAMIRSALFFSGANNFIENSENSTMIDDGILTAKEISQLDLKGLDLVVLSACQTGMGDISGDGVFGLQRGFKRAGANSIIMSLWKVDDSATQMLMVEFYKNLIDGKSKRESLKLAQKVVRDFKGEINGEYRNFSNPRYWAAFILLDGLD